MTRFSLFEWLLLSALMLDARAIHAETPNAAPEPNDRRQFSARSVSYAQLFQRALLPGPGGSLISSGTALPIYEYASLQASDVDVPWRKDSLDLELAVWGRGWLGERQGEQPFNGDVQVANLRYRQGPLTLHFGRQLVAGGAARFARFDGVRVDATLGAGLDADAYAGWTVLPRWDQRPRYEHLGAAPDALLREPGQLESVSRGRYWLAGGRLGWSAGQHRVGLSFHEQREAGGLARRNAGLDGRASLGQRASLGTTAVLDADRGRLADARLWLETRPLDAADFSFEYLHAEPALFLSAQSVLSVFGGATYDEAGVYATWRAGRALSVDGSGFAQVYADARPGARAELSARWSAERSMRTFVRLAYARLLAPDNGYHSVRASLSRALAAQLRATLEGYFYFYDEAIRGYRASSVYAGTLTFDATPALSVLWGASLARTPYAGLEAQAQMRVSYSFDAQEARR